MAKIEGKVAIVRSKSKISLPPRSVRLRYQTIKPPVIPDVVSLSRWLYGMRESGYPRCVIYNYSLTNDKASSQEFTEAIAQEWLSAAVQNWANSAVYPVPGDHCKSCQQPCLTGIWFTSYNFSKVR